MRNIFIIAAFIISCMAGNAQNIHDRLDGKVKQLLADWQMKHAIMDFYVVSSKTGKPVYDLNGQLGLAPASTQKIFTSIAALDTLGSNYRYKTEAGYTGTIKDSVLNGNLVIVGYGDPSFGSWRYPAAKREVVLRNIAAAVQQAGIKAINGDIVLNDSKFGYQPVPGGWPWEDLGNYYGAGTWGINWNENQFDLTFKPGDEEGDDAGVAAIKPELASGLSNLVKTGPKGSGDKANIYLPPNAQQGIVAGTVPAGEKRFTISGAIPYPADVFGDELLSCFAKSGIAVKGNLVTGYSLFNNGQQAPGFTTPLFTSYSPSLDSLVYWFLQKSINFYGETFARTIAFEKTGFGSSEKGVEMIRNYWQNNGIEKGSLKMIDGSGLSPQNRVTASAEVAALQYAKGRPWFSSFYNALPTFNGMRMKSGTIGGVKAFAGYHTSASGNQYTFSIIINNYEGDLYSIMQKMYTVLDALK